jgi:hypothetical protein
MALGMIKTTMKLQDNDMYNIIDNETMARKVKIVMGWWNKKNCKLRIWNNPSKQYNY